MTSSHVLLDQLLLCSTWQIAHTYIKNLSAGFDVDITIGQE